MISLTSVLRGAVPCGIALFSASCLHALQWTASLDTHYGVERELGWGYGGSLAASHESGFGAAFFTANFEEGKYHFKQSSRFAIVDRDFPIDTHLAGLALSYRFEFKLWALVPSVSAVWVDEKFDTLELLPSDGTNLISISDSYWLFRPALALERRFGDCAVNAQVSYLPLDGFVTGLPAAEDNRVLVDRETFMASLSVGYSF